MSLPVSLSNITWGSMGFPHGPWKSNAGNYYFLHINTSGNGVLSVQKATDPTSSWSVVASDSSLTWISNFAVFQVGDVLHIVVSDNLTGGNAAVYYRTFNMATDAFVVSETIQGSYAWAQSFFGVGVVVRSGGEVVAVYDYAASSMGNNYGRVYYRRRTGVNTWSAGVEVDAGSTIDYSRASAILGVSDSVHFVYATHGTNLWTHRTLTSGNVLQNVVNAGTTNGYQRGVFSFNVSGTQKCGWFDCQQSNSTAYCHYFDSANVPTINATTISGTDLNYVFAAAVRDSDNSIWVVHSKAASPHDLVVSYSTNYGASFSSDVVAVSGIGYGLGGMSMRGTVYTRGGGNVVFPFVYYDNPNSYYNEYTIEAGTTAWDGAARFDGAGGLIADAEVKSIFMSARFSGAGGLVADARQVHAAKAKLSGAGGLVSGATLFNAGIYDTTGTTNADSIGGLSWTELEFGLVVDPNTAAEGDVLTFEVYYNGQKLKDYAVEPSFTFHPGAVTRQGSALLAGTGGLKVDATHTPQAAAKLSGAGELKADASVNLVAITWNPADKSSNISLSNGNLTASDTTTADGGVRATKPYSTGKYYFEVRRDSIDTVVTDDNGAGICLGSANLSTFGQSATLAVLTYQSGMIWLNGSSTGISLGTHSAGDVDCVAVDLDNSRVWLRRNGGNWNNSGSADPASNVGGISLAGFFSPGANNVYPAVCFSGPIGVQVDTGRFAIGDFGFSVPSGFVPWDSSIHSWLGSALFSGAGLLTAGATHAPQGAALLVGAGSLKVDATHTPQAAALFDGAGGLKVDATHTPLAAARFDGVGTLAVDATVKGVQQGSALLAGEGGLKVDATHAPQGAALLAGVGELKVDATHTPLAAARFDGVGGLKVDATHTPLAAALLAGEGGLAADANVKGVQQGSALLAGEGGLAADASVVLRAAARFDGVGSMLAVATHAPLAAAKFDGVGSMLAAATHTPLAAAKFDGVGGLKVDATHTPLAAARFDGVGGLAADAAVKGVQQGSALLAGAGGLVADATVLHAALQGAARFDGVGALLADATHTPAAAALLAGSGDLIADASVKIGFVQHQGSALLEGAGGLAVDATHTPQAIIELIGRGDIIVDANVLAAASSAMDGAGGLIADAYVISDRDAAALFSGQGGMRVHAFVPKSWIGPDDRIIEGDVARLAEYGDPTRLIDAGAARRVEYGDPVRLIEHPNIVAAEEE